MKIRRTHGANMCSRTQRVLELVDLAEPGVGVVALADHVAVHPLGALGLPFQRRPVHPGEDQVDVEADVRGVLGEHVLDRRPGLAEPFHGAPHHLVGPDAPSGQRILDRQDDLVGAERPQFDLHPRRRAVTQSARRRGLAAGTAGRSGPAAPREPTVRDQHGRTPFGINSLRVERNVDARPGQGLAQLFTAGSVDGQHRPLVVPADQQIPYPRPVKHVPDEQQVLDHRLRRCGGDDRNGESALVQHQICPVDPPGPGGRRRRQRTLEVPPSGWGRIAPESSRGHSHCDPSVGPRGYDRYPESRCYARTG